MATGRVLWDVSLPAGVGDGIFLWGDQVVIRSALPEEIGSVHLSVHDAGTGRLMWSRTHPAGQGEMVLSVDHSGFYATVAQPTESGAAVRTTVYDRETGLPKGEFTDLIPNYGPLSQHLVRVGGEDRIAAVKWRRDGPVVLDLRSAEGRLLWSTEVWHVWSRPEEAPGAGPPHWFVESDGTHLLLRRESNAAAVIDGATGAVILPNLPGDFQALVGNGQLLSLQVLEHDGWQATLHTLPSRR